MAEIPNDVMRDAYAAAENPSLFERIDSIARLIMQERERCAKIVDSHPNAHYSAVRDAIMSEGAL